MSTRDETAPTPPSFRLETFGTLILRGIEGRTVVADHGQKGVRLALLAVLASAGERGCSRDRLLLLFWPDASQKRARHSLEQLLYTMRKSMGEDLFLGVNPIRLNGAVITSDIGDFQHALEVGDPEAVVGHYQGPFLDGFYLSDSPEFEQWMIAERAGLEGVYVKALERRAQSAEAAEEYETAVTWRQKLCDTDPLSGRHAIALMQALADAGDHAAALRHADEYDRLVNQELGTGMGPEIATLAAALRARGDVEPPSRSPDADAFPLKRPSPVASRSPESETGRDPPAARRAEAKPLRRIVPYATAGLAVAALAFAATRLRDAPPVGPAATTSETSIAVLPLANVSGDPADAGLADGMTEELIAVLARSGDLRVIASTSVFALEERSLDVRQIADSLRVSHVVEGGLQKIGSRLRMQVRLVDARDGTTLWSETYDRAFEDVFAVQEEIARAVAQELDVQLAGGDRPGSSLVRHQPKSLAAYEWYLRGMDVGRRQRHEQDAEYFQRAIAADTTYAAAYAGLARTYILMSPGPDRREFEADAERAARRAVALEDSLAEGHEALGWVHLIQKDFSTAEAEFKRAIALDPHSHAHEGLAHLYLWTGTPAKQLAEARLALENDPFSRIAIREVGRALLVNGRCNEALPLLHPLREVGAGYAGLIIGQCHAIQEKWPEAIAELRWAEENSAGSAPAFLGYALARAGRREEATAVLSDLLTGQKYSHGAFGVAVVYTGLRDYDQAFAWLDKAVDENSITRDLMLPLFNDLHYDSRFEPLKRRLGLRPR